MSPSTCGRMAGTRPKPAWRSCLTLPAWLRWGRPRNRLRPTRSTSYAPSAPNSAAFGQPLGLHHQQRHHLQPRGGGVEFAVTLIDVDDDAFGVQPSRVLAEVDGVGGFGPRQALAVGGLGLLGDVSEIATYRADSIGVGDWPVAGHHNRCIHRDHHVARRYPVGDGSRP